MARNVSLVLIVSFAMAGCSGTGGDSAERDLKLRQSTENNLGIVMDIARGLRDERGGVQPPSQDEVFAAVRQRHPAPDPSSDVLHDGWGRPLRYEIIDEAEGSSLRNGFRVLSAGANGEFENGAGDDVQRESVITATARGG